MGMGKEKKWNSASRGEGDRQWVREGREWRACDDHPPHSPPSFELFDRSNGRVVFAGPQNYRFIVTVNRSQLAFHKPALKCTQTHITGIWVKRVALYDPKVWTNIRFNTTFLTL